MSESSVAADVARALTQVRDLGLYVELGFASWAHYCIDRLGQPEAAVNAQIQAVLERAAATCN